MNFLAHCALAADASETWNVDAHYRRGLLAGAIIADFCKGRVNTQWPRPLQGGIRLHRRIDAVSNQHAAIRNSCQLYPKELRRYAPIFVDILADYHLSHRWQDYYAEPIHSFALQCYSAVASYRNYLPEHGHKVAAYMQDSDLLSRYHDWTTIESAIRSSLRRLRRIDLTDVALSSSQVIVTQSADDFALYYEEFQGQLVAWRHLLNAA